MYSCKKQITLRNEVTVFFISVFIPADNMCNLDWKITKQMKLKKNKTIKPEITVQCKAYINPTCPVFFVLVAVKNLEIYSELFCLKYSEMLVNCLYLSSLCFYFAVLYSMVALLAFVVMPFMYFYYEEKDEDATTRQV